ncbi:MerR family transcriptional regulator [Actinomadura citrea]|jgi:DNA-binding transcriptional MerR regulator|uniref:DNA-binding transcriptional MerR regulator n=1 Tax=Actinomadura citrea TaxID=46158 RepID=A0A7Y9GGP0_9ACTN|nr:MerR family transcriptional regulator [Actinomadura citrea]NYE16172.1 DNA-binding transcriptional MerR regulator [Actinomadura citrea]GGT81581.1 MerR family transcriptional regulator [Actinomadura citrea]
MRIGDLSAATGVSRRLLRYYEEQGLLRPLRSANGYRQYAPSDVVAVRHVRALLAAGLPTAVIARFLHCLHDGDDGPVPASCPSMVADLRGESDRIAGMITRLQSYQQALHTLLAAAQRPADGTPGS